MQNVEMTLNHLSGSGWRNTSYAYIADERQGLEAGRDVFSTARGMAINRMKRHMLIGAQARLIINGKIFIDIVFDTNRGIFEKSAPREVVIGETS